MEKKMTKEEWEKRGVELFGEDRFKWRFVCPGCGQVQSLEDFRKYKDRGATPDSATCECLGRYEGGNASWLAGKVPASKRCDYAGYGLLRISPVTVVEDDGEERMSFAFDGDT